MPRIGAVKFVAVDKDAKTGFEGATLYEGSKPMIGIVISRDTLTRMQKQLWTPQIF